MAPAANKSRSSPIISSERTCGISDEICIAGSGHSGSLRGNRGAECRVSLAGRITIDSSPDLLELLRQRLESARCKILTVDLSRVTYVDTSGLAILGEVLKAAKIQRKTLQLSELRGRPRYLLETTRLLHLFHEVDRKETPPAGDSRVGNLP